jgi:GABA permease
LTIATEPVPEIETPGLSKALRSRHVAMISIGGIIGAGLFVGSSASIAATGPAIVLSYLLAGGVMLLVMRMLGEMAVAHPEIGAFTEFSRVGLGSMAGFLSGWLYWYFWVVVVAIEALAGANLIHDWLPAPVWLIGWALLAVMTAVNLLSARAYGEFEFWFSSLKVAAIVVFIVLAGAYALGFTSHAGPTFANLVSHGGFAPFGPMSVFAGATSVIFALCGAEIATIAAAESPEPARTIAKMTTSVVVRILLFYVLSILLIVAVVPWNTIKPGVSPFAVALDHVGIPGAALTMKLVVLVAVLSCLNSGLYVTSRVLFTLAAHGDAPRALVSLNRRKTPGRAILIGSAFGYLAILASVLSPTLVFAFLVNASGAIMLFVYLITALAQIRIRRRLERAAPERLTVKMWLFPYLSWFAVAAMLAILLAMAFTPALASQLVASFGCLLVIAGAYLIRRRR